MNKISLIITVLNENTTILNLLNSIKLQTFQPHEVIIVDGGSNDNTVLKIKQFSNENPSFNITVKEKIGNRSVGRNYAVSLAKNNLIAITDAGCTLDKNWLKELLDAYKSPVVAGFYSANPTNDFQKAVVPYVLVMPNRVNSNNFLPATRSMLIEKKIFQKLGGFDERLSDNEDYAFAKKMQKEKIPITFAKKAIVYWQPTQNIKQFYKMIFRFAKGDIFSGIVRPKVVLIFARYVLFFALFLVSTKLFLAILCFYSVWAIQKNKDYVDNGWKYLPLLQIASDLAVIHGSAIGFMKRIS